MNIDTVRFSHILETSELASLNYFLAHTAFVVSHKSESIETLLGVLWYLPINSPIIIVTNCPPEDLEGIRNALTEQLTHHKHTYLVHQKDEHIATWFHAAGVQHILGADGRVVNGKGEGMYIGTLCAQQLGYPEWIIFYDADNFVPSALLEYTLAMRRLFMSTPPYHSLQDSEALVVGEIADNDETPALHNVRICWSSKPNLGSKDVQTRLLGRCTRVVSPLFSTLLEERFGIHNYAIYSSNAGEQGLTMKTATTLRFSSGFSVETFQLLDFLFHAAEQKDRAGSAILQQYQSKSPHFHDKKDDAHINKMIAESLGCFFLFESFLTPRVRRQLKQVYRDLHLELRFPAVYPALKDVSIGQGEAFVNRYSLFRDTEKLEAVLASQEVTCGSF